MPDRKDIAAMLNAAEAKQSPTTKSGGKDYASMLNAQEAQAPADSTTLDPLAAPEVDGLTPTGQASTVATPDNGLDYSSMGVDAEGRAVSKRPHSMQSVMGIPEDVSRTNFEFTDKTFNKLTGRKPKPVAADTAVVIPQTDPESAKEGKVHVYGLKQGQAFAGSTTIEAISEEERKQMQEHYKREMDAVSSFIKNDYLANKDELSKSWVGSTEKGVLPTQVGREGQDTNMAPTVENAQEVANQFSNRLVDPMRDAGALKDYIGVRLSQIAQKEKKELEQLYSKYTPTDIGVDTQQRNLLGVNVEVGTPRNPNLSYADQQVAIAERERMAASPEGQAEIKAVRERYSKERDNIMNGTAGLAYQKVVNTALKSGQPLNPLEIGIAVQKVLGDEKEMEKQERLTRKGMKLPPSKKVENELIGYRAIDYAARAAVADGREVEADTLAAISSNYHEKVRENNPQFVKEQKAQAINNELFRGTNPIYSSITGYTVNQAAINEAASRLGLDPTGITPEDVSQPSNILSRTLSSFIEHSAGGLFTSGMRGVANIADRVSPNSVDWDKFNDRYGPEWYDNTFLGKALHGGAATEAGLFAPETTVNLTPGEKHLMPMKNPKAGDFTWNVSAILGQVAEGAGQMAAFATGGGMIGRAATAAGVVNKVKQADAIGLSANTVLTQWNSSYNDALAAIGDAPEDETKRNAYTFMRVAAAAITEQILPDTQVARNIFGPGTGAGRELIDMLQTRGIRALEASTTKGLVARAIMGGAKDWGKEVSEDVADQAASIVTDMILAPKKYAEDDQANAMKQTVITSAISSFLPTFTGGVKRTIRQDKMNQHLLYQVGSEPDQYIAEIETQVTDGTITREEGNDKIKLVNTMNGIVKNVEDIESVGGQPLSPDQRVKYANNLLQQTLLNAKKEGVTDDVLLDNIDQQVAALKAERTAILTQPPAPTVAPEVVTGPPPIPADINLFETGQATSTIAPQVSPSVTQESIEQNNAAALQQARDNAAPSATPIEQEGQPRTELDRVAGYPEIQEDGTVVMPTVNEAVNSGVTLLFNGQRATLSVDGQTVLANIAGTNRSYEVGNVNELGDVSAGNIGLAPEIPVVEAADNGVINVRGVGYTTNNYSNPLAAINTDADGNIVSVNLDTQDGQRRTFRGQVAEDIAYQIHLQQVSNANQLPSLEQFLNEDPDAIAAFEENDGRLEATARETPPQVVAEVPAATTTEINAVEVPAPPPTVLPPTTGEALRETPPPTLPAPPAGPIDLASRYNFVEDEDVAPVEQSVPRETITPNTTQNATQESNQQQEGGRAEGGIGQYQGTESQRDAAALGQADTSNRNTGSQRQEEGQVGQPIRDRFAAAPRIEGAPYTRTLADGTPLAGRYVLTTAEAVTPSHSSQTFTTSEGFPLLEDGRNPNDRDYSLPENRQLVIARATNYDGRAVENVPTVDANGIVIDGNDRVMSGQIAARQGTDTAYIERLRANAASFGFTAQQVDDMIANGQSPRVVFQADQVQPYTTETFARFNPRSQGKAKSVFEEAVQFGKTLSDRTMRVIADAMSGFGTMSEFYKSTTASKNVKDAMVQAGVLSQDELPRYFDVRRNAFTEDGKRLLENMMLGRVFDEASLAVLESNPGVKQKMMLAIKNLLAIDANPEYSLRGVIGEALALKQAVDAYAAESGIQDKQQALKLYMQQGDMFAAKPSDEAVVMWQEIEAKQTKSMLNLTNTIVSQLENYQPGAGPDLFGESKPVREALVVQLSQKINEYESSAIEQPDVTPAAEERINPIDNESAPAVQPVDQGAGQPAAVEEVQPESGRVDEVLAPEAQPAATSPILLEPSSKWRISNKGIETSGVFGSEDLGLPAMFVAYPIKDSKGNPIGQLQKVIINQGPGGKGDKFQVLDTDGQVTTGYHDTRREALQSYEDYRKMEAEVVNEIETTFPSQGVEAEGVSEEARQQQAEAENPTLEQQTPESIANPPLPETVTDGAGDIIIQPAVETPVVVNATGKPEKTGNVQQDAINEFNWRQSVLDKKEARIIRLEREIADEQEALDLALKAMGKEEDFSSEMYIREKKVADSARAKIQKLKTDLTDTRVTIKDAKAEVAKAEVAMIQTTLAAPPVVTPEETPYQQAKAQAALAVADAQRITDRLDEMTADRKANEKSWSPAQMQAFKDEMAGLKDELTAARKAKRNAEAKATRLKAKSTADSIRKLKGDDDIIASSFGISPKLGNRIIEGIAKIVEAGGNIQVAIDAAVDEINNEWFGDWNEAKFRKMMGEGRLLALSPDEIRAQMDAGIPLSKTNLATARLMVDDIRNNIISMRQAMEIINSTPKISDGTKANMRQYVKQYANEEIFKPAGEQLAAQSLQQNNNDYDAAINSLLNDRVAAVAAATSQFERENLEDKYIEALTNLQTDKATAGIMDGTITPNYDRESQDEETIFPNRQYGPPLVKTGRGVRFNRENIEVFKRKFLERFQNRYRTAEELVAGSPTPVGEDTNFADALHLQDGRADDEKEVMQDRIGYVTGKKGTLFGDMAADGIKLPQLDLFMLAQHAPERNAHNAQQRKSVFQRRLKDLNIALRDATDPAVQADLRDLIDDMLSQDPKRSENKGYVLMPDGGMGMTNEEARIELQKVEDAGETALYEKYAERFRTEVIDHTLDVMLESGIITPEKYNHLRRNSADTSHYKFYVPAKVKDEYFEDTEGVSSRDQKNKPRGINAIILRSRGAAGIKTTDRVSPVQQALNDLETAIGAKWHNITGMTMAKFMKEHPDPAWNVVAARHDVIRGMNDEIVKVIPVDKPADVVREFKDNGVLYYITSTNPGIKNIFRDTPGRAMAEYLSKIPKFLSAVRTRYSPEFIVKNPIIDYFDASFALRAQDDKRYIENFKKIGITGHYKIAKALNGEANEYSDWVADARKHAGVITFFNSIHKEDGINNVLKLYESLDSKNPLSFANRRRIARALSGFTDSLEEMTRVRVYIASVETGIQQLMDGGMSRSEAEKKVNRGKAALISRNATLDFGKRGVYGQWLNIFKTFLNAATLGATNSMYYATKKGPGGNRARAKLGFFVVMGMAAQELGRLLGDCDDPANQNADCWDEINEYDKQKNIMIPWFLIAGKGAGYVKIPLGRAGYGSFNYLGNKLGELIHGEIGVGNFVANTLAGMGDTYNPVGSESLPMAAFGNMSLPFALWFNKNPMHNGPIYPEKEGVLRSQSYTKKTPSLYVELANSWHEATGGGPGKASDLEFGGFGEIAPGQMEHFMRFMGGGVYSILHKTATGGVPFKGIVKSEDKMNVTRGKYYKIRDKAGKELLSQEEWKDMLDLSQDLVEGGIIEPVERGRGIGFVKSQQSRVRRNIIKSGQQLPSSRGGTSAPRPAVNPNEE